MSAMPRMVPLAPKSQFLISVKPVPKAAEVGPGPTAGLDRVPPPTVWAAVVWVPVGVGRGVGLADAGTVGGCVGGPVVADEPPDRTHFWFDPPLQSHSCAFVPLAVSIAFTSRQRFDCIPVIVPSR